MELFSIRIQRTFQLVSTYMLWYIYLFHGNKTRPASSSYEMLTDSVIFCLSFYAL